MPTIIETALYDIGRLETLAEKDSIVHRLDARAKLLVTLAFILAVVSFDRYSIGGLLPFFLYPAIIIGLADLPPNYLLRKLLIVSPFVLFIGVFNPILDQEIFLQIGTFGISGGWLSFLSLLIRFSLTVGAALLLIATTGFPAVCAALSKLGVPRILTVQLLLLYRYLFVLIEEGITMIRAHALRSFDRRHLNYRSFTQLLGNLLLRTIDRAQRIHMAMLSRAFTGEIRISRPTGFGGREIVFLLISCSAFVTFRLINLTDLLGRIILEIGQ
jgi:cobalt/nickel transport system permease protein